MMNIWIPAYTNWVGEFIPSTLPAYAYYDWAAYYSYRPGSGNYGTNNNFSFIWKDDFDSWDQSRWDKATHTWDGNNCDFVKENVTFNDGKLILCLTTPENVGYTDISAPFALWSRAENNKVKIRFSEDIDKTSAENKALYIISGVTIDNVELLSDNVTVELSCTNLDLKKNYSVLILSGIKDLFNNASGPKAVTVNMPKQFTFPIKINVGSTAQNGYLPDQEWSETVDYGYLDGSQGATSMQINNTEEDAIFQSERYGLVTYKVRVPNGTYKVSIMTAENFFNESGLRIFDIYAENILVKNDLDLYSEAGKNTAYIITAPSVIVEDGILDLYFAAEVNNPLLNGIVIESISTGVNDDFSTLKSFELYQNYPNPFNAETKISFSLPQQDKVTFAVYDLLGNQVYLKNLGIQKAGFNELSWKAMNNEGEPLASGIYIYTVSGLLNSTSKKLILLK